MEPVACSSQIMSTDRCMTSSISVRWVHRWMTLPLQCVSGEHVYVEEDYGPTKMNLMAVSADGHWLFYAKYRKIFVYNLIDQRKPFYQHGATHVLSLPDIDDELLILLHNSENSGYTGIGINYIRTMPRADGSSESLAVCDGVGDIYLYDIADFTKKPILFNNGYSSTWGMGCAPGELFVSCNDHSVRRLSFANALESGFVFDTLYCHTQNIPCVDVDSSYTYIASCDIKGNLRIAPTVPLSTSPNRTRMLSGHAHWASWQVRWFNIRDITRVSESPKISKILDIERPFRTIFRKLVVIFQNLSCFEHVHIQIPPNGVDDVLYDSECFEPQNRAEAMKIFARIYATIATQFPDIPREELNSILGNKDRTRHGLSLYRRNRATKYTFSCSRTNAYDENIYVDTLRFFQHKKQHLEVPEERSIQPDFNEQGEELMANNNVPFIDRREEEDDGDVTLSISSESEEESASPSENLVQLRNRVHEILDAASHTSDLFLQEMRLIERKEEPRIDALPEPERNPGERCRLLKKTLDFGYQIVSKMVASREEYPHVNGDDIPFPVDQVLLLLTRKDVRLVSFSQPGELTIRAIYTLNNPLLIDNYEDEKSVFIMQTLPDISCILIACSNYVHVVRIQYSVNLGEYTLHRESVLPPPVPVELQTNSHDALLVPKCPLQGMFAIKLPNTYANRVVYRMYMIYSDSKMLCFDISHHTDTLVK